MTHQYITLWKIDDSIDYPLVKQGSINRDYLNNTYKNHGYHCQPITVMNTHGWEFILPHDVIVRWDGVSSSEASHVQIVNGSYYKSCLIASNITANGTITFHFNAHIETDNNHYVLFSGPPNYFVDGAVPMNALWRSDYYSYMPINFCWKLTKVNEDIIFKAGTPILFMINYPKGLLENTRIDIKNLKDNEDLKNRSSEYSIKRNNYYKELDQWSWPNLYKKGIGPGDENHLNSIFKPRLQEP